MEAAFTWMVVESMNDQVKFESFDTSSLELDITFSVSLLTFQENAVKTSVIKFMMNFRITYLETTLKFNAAVLEATVPHGVITASSSIPI